MKNKLVSLLLALRSNTKGDLVQWMVVIAVVVTLGLTAAKVIGGAWGTKANTQKGEITGL